MTRSELLRYRAQFAAVAESDRKARQARGVDIEESVRFGLELIAVVEKTSGFQPATRSQLREDARVRRVWSLLRRRAGVQTR